MKKCNVAAVEVLCSYSYFFFTFVHKLFSFNVVLLLCLHAGGSRSKAKSGTKVLISCMIHVFVSDGILDVLKGFLSSAELHPPWAPA